MLTKVKMRSGVGLSTILNYVFSCFPIFIDRLSTLNAEYSFLLAQIAILRPSMEISTALFVLASRLRSWNQTNLYQGWWWVWICSGRQAQSQGWVPNYGCLSLKSCSEVEVAWNFEMHFIGSRRSGSDGILSSFMLAWACWQSFYIVLVYFRGGPTYFY